MGFNGLRVTVPSTWVRDDVVCRAVTGPAIHLRPRGGDESCGDSASVTVMPADSRCGRAFTRNPLVESQTIAGVEVRSGTGCRANAACIFDGRVIAVPAAGVVLLVAGEMADDGLVQQVVASLRPQPGLETPGDDIHGGRGARDSIPYLFNPGSVDVSLDDKPDDGLPGEHDNINSDVERVAAPSLGMRAVGNGVDDYFLCGNRAGNRLVGRGGHDNLIAENGDDYFDARDGHGGDSINCGGGQDTDLLDHGDRMTNPRACEHVRHAR